MARSYQLYYKDQGSDLYGTGKVFFPKPELYVIYIGDEKDKSGEISLAQEFLDGDDSVIDIKIKVICESEGSDIISQYILFTKVYGEQVKKYGRTQMAILETIRICKERNILKEYLESREKEVADIMTIVFDDEKDIYDAHFKTVAREHEAIGEARGEAIGEARGEAIGEARGTVKGKIETTIEMSKEFGQTRESTIQRLIDRFDLSPDEAKDRVNAVWSL